MLSNNIFLYSEAEKYEKSLYKGKQKLSPQDSWMQSIETAVSKYDDAPISIQPHLQKLLEFNNIPRNKNKFVNFLKNSLKLHSSSVIDELWNFVSSYYNKPTSSIQEIDNTSKESNQSAISNVLLDEIKDKTIQINKCEEPSNGKMKESKKSKKKRKIENEESEVQKRKCEQISGNE